MFKPIEKVKEISFTFSIDSNNKLERGYFKKLSSYKRLFNLIEKVKEIKLAFSFVKNR